MILSFASSHTSFLSHLKHLNSSSSMGNAYPAATTAPALNAGLAALESILIVGGSAIEM